MIMNFDEFKKPLPTDPEEISKGIDELLKPAQFFVPRDEEDKDEIDAKIRETSFSHKQPARTPTLEEALNMTPEQEKAFWQSQNEEPDDGEEGELIEDKRFSGGNDIENDIKEIVDPDFLDGRMIYSEVIHFWPTEINEKHFLSMSPKKLDYFVHAIPHYREGYEQKRDEALRINEESFRSYGPATLQKFKDFENGFVRRIMELSDPNQVRKYDKLVDKFNADRERIIKERDYESLQKYIAKVKALVGETK